MPQMDHAKVRVGEELIIVDLAACAPQAAFFAVIQSKGQQNLAGASSDDAVLPEFPGGADVFRSLARHLESTAGAAAQEVDDAASDLSDAPDTISAKLELTKENIATYIEASALLRCPRLMRETVMAQPAKELGSRAVLRLLERIIRITGEGMDSSSETDSVDEWTRYEHVKTAFCQVIQRLMGRLDPTTDLRLTASLAAGKTWASLEVLDAYRVKIESANRMNYALQSVTSTVKSLFTTQEDPAAGTKQQVHKLVWKEHHFALHVFRKHLIESTLFSKNSNLRASAELAMLEQEPEIAAGRGEHADDGGSASATDGHARQGGQRSSDDIPEALCDGVLDSTLAELAGFVQYCDPMQTPPVLAAAMIRALLVTKDDTGACSLYEGVFVRSRKAQAMVVTGQVPVHFLCQVKAHRVAARVLRQLLAKYESVSPKELIHLLDTVLLEEFAVEPYFSELVLSNSLVRDIVVYLRVHTKDAAEKAGADASADSNELLKLRQVGEKLFAAGFVEHRGFLPVSVMTSEEKEREKDSLLAEEIADTPTNTARASAFIASADVLNQLHSTSGSVECPWDSGDLDLPLLARAPRTEESLRLIRCVLLRGLIRRERTGNDYTVSSVVKLWPLGHWQDCREGSLVAEAFRFLQNFWKHCMLTRVDGHAGSASGPGGASGSGSAASDEEALFALFAELELWLLPTKELLTPYLPPQLLACHISQRCRELDEQQQTIIKGNRANIEEINRLRLTVSQLSAKLEATDQRSKQSLQRQVEVTGMIKSLR